MNTIDLELKLCELRHDVLNNEEIKTGDALEIRNTINEALELVKKLTITDVNGWFLIENNEPVENTRIIYEGNCGGIEATYLGKNKDGVGVALLDNGHKDIFDRWKSCC